MKFNTRLCSTASLFAVAVGAALLISGCATIFNGTSQEVKVQSEPSGADVLVEGSKRGTTPTTIDLTKPQLNEVPKITLEKEGYSSQTLKPQTKFATVSILNIINPFGHLLGFGIDAFTGALWKYNPETYTVELQQGEESASLMKRDASSETARIKTYNMSDLETDENGNRVVPDHEAVNVYDADQGVMYTFR